MAERRSRSSSWHGHTLRPLPAGESWLSGGERVPPIHTDPTYLRPAPDDPLEELWSFSELNPTPSTAVAARVPAPANARWTGALLVVVSLAAILTIVFARNTGGPATPAPLPAPPSHVISSVSRTQATTASIHVGDYVDFQLPSGRSYSTVLEQASSQIPVVEALTLPGQQPQLRADSTGHAVIEVMSAPLCNNPDGCPDQRSLLGTVELTVTP